MDDMRVCGNGHLFAFSAGSCPECDSVASRPATAAEVRAGTAEASAAESELKDGLAQFLAIGIGLAVLAWVLMAVDLFLLAVLGYLVGLVALGLLLVALIGFGVREGMAAHTLRLRREERLTVSERPPS